MKYVKMICGACVGAGWNWGGFQGVEHIKCKFCDGTGIHKAEIVEEEDKEKDKKK